MSKFRFGILGGDYRYKLLYNKLIDDGYIVKAYNNTFITQTESSLASLLENTDVLIGPIPTTKDNAEIYLANSPSIKITELFEAMRRRNLFTYIGGVISSDVRQIAEKNNITLYDFFAMEEVAISNAIPTAEGAVATAINESDITLFGSRALVLGYGRCGKILANMLKGIGADTYATYRAETAAAYINAFGIQGINLSDLKSKIHIFNYIFNTIPAPVLTKDVLKKVNKKCLIIDIAQAPGGTDFNFARDLNLRALYCPGLPGRVAPLTAAEILKSAVISIALK